MPAVVGGDVGRDGDVLADTVAGRPVATPAGVVVDDDCVGKPGDCVGDDGDDEPGEDVDDEPVGAVVPEPALVPVDVVDGELVVTVAG